MTCHVTYYLYVTTNVNEKPGAYEIDKMIILLPQH